jgi:DNA-binding response OmpR family regulator
MSRRVLIVDDDTSLLAFLALHFEELGWEVLPARTYREALVQAKPPLHLALLDYRLPDGDGLQLLTKLRMEAPHLPVVMMSAHRDAEVMAEAFSRGAQRFLSKPFGPSELEAFATVGS